MNYLKVKVNENAQKNGFETISAFFLHEKGHNMLVI